MRRCGRALLAAAALMIGGCVTTSELAPPPPASLSSPEVTEGRRIYITCAGSCHSPEPVMNYTRSEWLEKHVPEMAIEAKLSAAQRAALQAYILACLSR